MNSKFIFKDFFSPLKLSTLSLDFFAYINHSVMNLLNQYFLRRVIGYWMENFGSQNATGEIDAGIFLLIFLEEVHGMPQGFT